MGLEVGVEAGLEMEVEVAFCFAAVGPYYWGYNSLPVFG